ncbi:C45 family peptidase [Desulfovibrio sp.]|uniref:C45 family autoproteolytic acyltransferase/hydolase n=1 Tax=Desulfovibrio sp. TaxID=885 RepID=UPI0025C14ED5|nr:C45 family peptidase [Desulfovibrio sp.]
MPKLLYLLCALVLLAAPVRADACTLWAAAGPQVAGGGTIIVKNRDWRPDNQQKIRLATKGKYRFIYLEAEGNSFSGAKQGINEKGLAIVLASAPREVERAGKNAGMTKLRILLASYASVQEALAALKAGAWVTNPQFMVLADAKEIACVEFGPGGQYAVVAQQGSGVVFHTNHYVSPQLEPLNPHKLSTSLDRYNKISSLLQAGAPFDVQKFQAFSTDPTLWRAGATPSTTRTLSSWIIRQMPDGSGTLYLRMANPDHPVKEYRFALKDLFEGKVDLSLVQ